MMRSHLARQVCRTRTGVIGDAIRSQSRPLCLKSRSPRVPALHGVRRTNSQQPYSTNRATDDTEANATETNKGLKEAPSEHEGSKLIDSTYDPSSPAEETGLGVGENPPAGKEPAENGTDAEATNRAYSVSPTEKDQDTNAVEKRKGQTWQMAGMGEPLAEFEPKPRHPKHEQDLNWLSESFRRVLRRQTNGVTVITARTSAGNPVGSTVSSFSSVSVHPKPFFSFNLQRRGQTFEAIVAHGATFNIHMLDCTEEGVEVAEKFVGRSKVCSKGNIWKHLNWTGDESEPPMLQGPEIPWVFTCKVAFSKNVADHSLVVAEVIDITPKGEVPTKIELHGGFLTFRDGWYREPGLDFEDAMSRLKRLRRNEKLEFMRIKEERRLAHEKNLERALESQRNRERRAEHEHERRQAAHERKQKGMMLKLAEHDFPAWEAKIRADEREKMRAEGRQVREVPVQRNPASKQTLKEMSKGSSTDEEGTEGGKSEDSIPVMAPWRN